MTLADWLEQLERISSAEIVMGLERVAALIERLELSIPSRVLTIAGTNGKGSTVAIAESICRSGGLTTGAYTSPHILRYNERIRIDGEPVPDAELIASFEVIESVRGDIPLTYFEYGTLAAIRIIAKHRVDVALLEVGMGGRLDAVNAFEPDASLITNISLDHCAWLGPDIESIAREKAGVMRRGKPTVFASQEVPAAIPAVAARVGADLYLAGQDYRWVDDGATWQWRGRRHVLDGLSRPALTGSIQLQNAAGVLALLESAGLDGLLRTGTINPGLERTAAPGRMQAVTTDRRWLFDVAHNPAAAEALSGVLAEMSASGLTIAAIGMLDDKDVEACVRSLAPRVDRWIAFTAASPRALSGEELARRVANATGKACLEAESADQAMTAARSLSGESDRILVTGSFYAVGPALEALELYSRR